MNASETKLQAIIEGTKQYLVPLFQRSYSWEKKDWDLLWNDLFELTEIEEPREHFIGSIVTMSAVSVPEGVAKFLLIDGQQRLTTIFILLTTLRNKFIEHGENEMAEEINNTMLTNPYKRGIDHYKLLPTHVDRLSYKYLIDGTDLREDNKIVSAYKYFERKLQNSNVDFLINLKKVISNQVSVVSIVLGPNDNPHLVFESLNAKGRPLSQSDLIRNYFFMRIHVDQQEKIYSEYWKPMQDSLEDDLTNYIRHYLMKDGTQVKEDDVYFAFKNRINHLDTLPQLKDLYIFSKYYNKLLKPENEPNEVIRRCIMHINRLEAKSTFPFLLNCYDDFAKNKLTVTEFVATLEIVENYLIRRFVCNISTKQLSKIFPPLYNSVIDKGLGSFIQDIKDILQTKVYPKDADFMARLQDSSLYGPGERARKTKLILESLEQSYGHKEQVILDDLTIEHVMPQTLNEQWQHYLGDNWEITHDLLLHTIGNLTLTAYNAELSNDDYDDKKKYFAESHVELNGYFKDEDSWKKDNIEKRALHLTNIALSVWPYFGNEQNIIGNSNNVTGTTPSALWILGQRIEVSSWRDVFESTLNTIADIEPEKFDLLTQQFSSYVGKDKKKFRAIRQLRNGLFIEVHLSAQSIQRLCYKAMEAIELTSDEWNVETV